MLIVLIPVLFTSTIKANAINTGFDTCDMPAEEKTSIISNINLTQITEEPAKKSIVCFAVSDNHMIAVGQEASIKKTVCVYSSEGAFQYGYTFVDYGPFGLEWDGENLNIYFVRGGLVISVTPSGEVIDVLDIQDTTHNNSYTKDILYSTKRKIGCIEYTLENNMGFLNSVASSYSILSIINANGEKNVIYNVHDNQLFNTTLKYVYTVTFICIVVVVLFVGIIIKLIVNHKRS